MSNLPTFWRDDELGMAESFVREGYVIQPAESRGDLDRIRDLIADITASYLKLPPAEDKGAFLDRIHEKVDVQRLNDLRLAVIREMNEEPWTRLAYFNTARRALEVLVGNELAMQLRINLSIQLPNDDSSLLPVHADVWAGDSPYEVVLWVPYVNVFGTKTMYILPRDKDSEYQARMGELKLKSAEALYRTIEPDLTWLDIPYGNVLLFTQNVMHGNVVNREPETRWSSNCRFKSIFSPYHDKKLGEFFEPILVRPATRIGAGYRLPSVA
ncbi:sporadic carbohydrate cluster 2OG-Fe(II) oxygenase [Reyranella sp.]|uniref:sporadic carbohydrate cluster 2OG-Fe(II) oxygenase n=1 Tax=Reyranella sp. TaxID=1929291 RepID=UPI003BA9A5A3